MTEDFLLEIRDEYSQFTKAGKKMTDYVLSNPKKVLFMPITELAEACGVGDTSMSHFRKTMSCEDYQEFKMPLSLSLHEGRQGFGQIESDISLEDSFSQVAEKVLDSNVKAPRETHSLLKGDVFRWVAECFHKVGRICFYGVGTSMATAMKVADKFLKIEPKVYCSPDSHIQAMMVSTTSRGEVAVISSYSGATKDTVHVVQLARQADAVIVRVTRFVRSPPTACVDLTLLCGANESLLQAGSSSVGIGQLFLIDMLYMEYYRAYYDECSADNEKTSASVMAKLC